jgi:hypothetical protein
MAQHDYNIANASFPTVRTDINNVLSAINSSNSGSSRPSSAVAGTIWLDTSGAATAQLLKMYDGAADILLATINTTANTVDWADSSVTGTIAHKTEGTNFTDSLLVGHATTGTLDSALKNTGVGIDTLDALTSGDENTALGHKAGTIINSGIRNTLLGYESGKTLTSGNQNTGVGRSALSLVTGNANVALGYLAGNNITSGSGNVVIGNADVSSATGDDQLSISDGEDGSVVWISGDSSGNVTVAGTLTSTTGLVKTIGKETMWIPSSAMYATTTNPAEAAQVETTALRPDMKVFDFAAAADDFVQFSVAFPKSWNEGTVTFQAFWTPSTTNTGDCIWALQGVAVGDGDTIDVAYGTAVTVTDAGIGTVEDQQVTAESGAVTIAGSPAVDQQTYFQFFRDANAGGDTFTGVARLLGIKIFFTTDAANDA